MVELTRSVCWITLWKSCLKMASMKCILRREIFFFFKKCLKSKTLLANDGRHPLGCEKAPFSVHKMYTACNICIVLSSFTGLGH